MSLIQFWRILWARRLLIIGVTVLSLIGGGAVLVIVPPRWQAEAHVFLNILKPDPVTGLTVAQDPRSYIATQINLITDYSVVGQAVDKLGWKSDPKLIQAYQNRSGSDTRDFGHWLAQIITDRAKAEIGDGSNILNISYTGSNPDAAKAVADALMQSYLDTSLAFRRADANKNADWYGLQAQKAKSSLEAAETAVTNFERDNGVVLTQDDKTDVDSARLASMAAQGMIGGEAAGSTSVDAMLAETDAAIKNASLEMGPNNPQMQALQAKRAGYAALIAREHSAASSTPSASGGSRIDVQKALVISQSGKLAKLRNLQTEVDITRDLYNKSAQKEVDFRQEAAVTDAGLTPLGNATVPAFPSFPKNTLVIGVAFGLGLFAGTALALLIELLNRKVRGAEDLFSAQNLPVLAVLSAPR
ncbi:MAG TPA: Wzz/FepE/Etk N-terminal domain-containing protein [Rhizomicrobium sp.]|jgi:succinoglycan biosynthesis transport protein ExoP|nr:Wzz/FepE/Etk N-terminal domain-containing protein [Rhizomicrobium sp.]